MNKLEGKLKQLFDIVVADPPSFARSKKHTFSANKDYTKLIEYTKFLEPTIKWFSTYIENLINSKDENIEIELDILRIRDWFRSFVEQLGYIVDGVVVGFLDNDEYYFLWINNLLRNNYIQDYNTIKLIVDYIESKKIIPFLESKQLSENKKIWYSFIKDENWLVSVMYTKLNFDWYDATIWILAPARVNYRKNVWVLKKLVG